MRSIADLLKVHRRSRKFPVSVVINTNNREEWIEKTLESLRGQTYSKFEVVVVTGPTAELTNVLLRRYAPDIKIARCSEQKIGVSRNIGIEAATGEIIAFIDDDAVPDCHWLEKLVLAYKDPSVAAVGGQVLTCPLDVSSGASAPVHGAARYQPMRLLRQTAILAKERTLSFISRAAT
jgi:glycosyltransferase involved in cell wall biosynthesis